MGEPKDMYFFLNRTIDFDDLEDLDPDNLGSTEFYFDVDEPSAFSLPELLIKLPSGRFRGCTSLAIAIKGNQSEDEDVCSFLNNLRVVGKPLNQKGIDAWEPCKS